MASRLDNRASALMLGVRQTLGLPDPLASEAPQLPSANQLADNPWERETARLIAVIGDRNRAFLELQQQIEAQDTRLRLAFAQLQSAESALEAQATAAATSPGTANTVAAPPSLVARLAAEKGVLETELRKLQREHTRAVDELRKTRDAVAKQTRTVAQTEATASQREQVVRQLETRLEQSSTSATQALKQAEAEARSLAEELTRAETKLKAAAEARSKAEQLARASEDQATLYRRNLVRAEETVRVKTQEIAATAAEVAQLRQEVRQLGSQRQALEANQRALTRALEQRATEAEQRAAAEADGRKKSEAECYVAQTARAEFEARVADLHKDCDAERASRQDIETELVEARRRLTEVTRELETATVNLSVLEQAWLSAKQLAARTAVVAVRASALADEAAAVDQADSATQTGTHKRTLLGWLRRN